MLMSRAEHFVRFSQKNSLLLSIVNDLDNKLSNIFCELAISANKINLNSRLEEFMI